MKISDENSEIQEYEFKKLFKANDRIVDSANFEFTEFKEKSFKTDEQFANVLKGERENAEKKNFKIAPIVRQFRGISEQERDEREAFIEEEVQRRVAKIEEDAFQKGYVDGVESGKKEVFDQTRQATEEKLQSLTTLISDTLSLKAAILAKEKDGIYKMIRNLTKWVILRELKDDGIYLERLLEKLIAELQTKNNILVQIDQRSFEQMPDILENVQKNIGVLKNVRLELDYDIEGPGIIVESENGIIDGTIEQQFKSLDKLFQSVGIVDSPKNDDLVKELSQENSEEGDETDE